VRYRRFLRHPERFWQWERAARPVGSAFAREMAMLFIVPWCPPIAIGLGINLHLGILMTLNMEVGICHPPVGLNLYVASGITRMCITELTIAVWPWLLTMPVFFGIVTYVPELSLRLPRQLGVLYQLFSLR
jgi:C4-dicarboxylate transporter DctM subunit